MQRVGIAVAGASCSGKTTLADRLAASLNATLVRIDDYYRPLDHLTFEERCDVNFDHPNAIDSELLVAHFRALVAGESIEMPRYDFTRHTRFPDTVTVTPGPVVLVEGIFALCYPELVEACPVRIFVDASEDVCLNRRVERDVAERGRTPGEVIGRFTGHVAPMFRRHVLPKRELATVWVSGEEPLEKGLSNVLRSVPNFA